jgi:Holliday junction DNA helicase RuvA
MIARIHGTLVEKSVLHCVVDVHGTGYRVVVPLTTFYELPETGQQVILHIHTHVREDAISLYGFHTAGEREVFQLMISVSGIGPKLAVNVLSGIDARELVRAVLEADLKRLTGIPGVGRKTAERMILELKEKVAKLEREGDTGAVAVQRDLQIQEDALSALINLGYRAPVAKDAVDRVLGDESATLTLDRLLKQALRILSG